MSEVILVWPRLDEPHEGEEIVEYRFKCSTHGYPSQNHYKDCNACNTVRHIRWEQARTKKQNGINQELRALLKEWLDASQHMVDGSDLCDVEEKTKALLGEGNDG